MCEYCLMQFGKIIEHPKVSPKRIKHLIDAFPLVKWNTETIKITDRGILGDKPQWSITGEFKNLILTWTSAGVRGAQPRLKVDVGNCVFVISNATLQRGMEIQNRLISKEDFGR